MPRIYLSPKEAEALRVIVLNYHLEYPKSHLTDKTEEIPERLQRCLDLQGNKKGTTRKDRA